MRLKIKPGKYLTRGGKVATVNGVGQGFAHGVCEGLLWWFTLGGEHVNGDGSNDLVSRIEEAHMMSAPKIQSTDEAWDERRLGADERYVAVAPDPIFDVRRYGQTIVDQAHMMSAPNFYENIDAIRREIDNVCGTGKPAERQHISDAGGNRIVFPLGAGTVFLTVAEHDKLLKGEQRLANSVYEDHALLCENDKLLAEVERLKKQADHYRDAYSAARKEVLDGLIEIERLRGAKDEPRNATAGDVLCRLAHDVADHALDHRLGIPQPEGDPTEPMSSRKPYRWGMV